MTKRVQSLADPVRLIFHQFFTFFTVLDLSANYVTKRQSLKLLGEILLDQANFNVRDH
jgi:calcium binding protein 39